MDVKVSIIIPVYKAENYIERCVRSLLEQTLEEMEFIFIDDCSPDDSITIIERVANEYPCRAGQIIIKQHTINKGVSATRNTGLSLAKGEFIGYCDSDDWIEPTMYKDMYECARKTSSEAVYCDINMIYKNFNKIYTAAQYSTDKTTFIRNHITTVWTSLCNTIVKSDIYKKHHLSSPEHLCYCEDFWLSVRLFHYANRVAYINKAFYNYNRENETSTMHSLSYKTEQDERKAYLETIDFFCLEGVGKDYEREMSWRILKSTHDSIFHRERYEEFLTIYPESHKYIWTCPYVNIKTKTLMWMLTHHLKFIALSIIKLRKILG